MLAETCQVEAHFKARNEGVLGLPSKIYEKLFHFRVSFRTVGSSGPFSFADKKNPFKVKFTTLSANFHEYAMWQRESASVV